MRALLIGLVLMFSSAVFAQPAPPPPAPQPAPMPVPVPTPDPGDEARRHFDQGVALLQVGNHAGALAELTESYRLRPVPAVLKNIAIAQQGLFRYSDAIATLQKYLAEATNLPPEEVAEVNNLIAEMKALLADVAIVVKPVGATITVDGRVAGKAPLAAPLALAAGIHIIEISAEGHEPTKREITVAAGVAQELKVDLVAIIKTARVRIKSTADGSAIVIDGKLAGLAPTEVELTAGGHTLEVSATGHKTYRSELTIAAGQDREITVPLERMKRWYQNWKVLTVIGASITVIGLSLAINYGTTEDPIQGTMGVGSIE